MNGIFKLPEIKNEVVLDYKAGSKERELLQSTLQTLGNEVQDLPMWIGGEAVRTNNLISLSAPHNHKKVIANCHYGTKEHVQLAIKSALDAKNKWSNLPMEQRAAIFLKAADLAAGPYRMKLNAATMMCQSKTVFQAEIDAVAELVDFLRFNVKYMYELYGIQPSSSPGIWNRLEYRPLEGFIFAITPFNFTAIASNLCATPALLGNTIVWKPADSQIYSASIVMEIFRAAGLPDGVINLIHVDGPTAGDEVFSHPDFAGLHFTGSTAVFKHLWKEIASNLDQYKTYPRIVGETGGKDYILAHSTAGPKEVATAIVRGAFEFQGQKCSAASRAYIPKSKSEEILSMVKGMMREIKMGTPENFENFVSAVIDEKAFDKISTYIENAKKEDGVEIYCGGKCDKSEGYFIEPTVILTKNPKSVTMCEEIFGPVITIYVYDDQDWNEVLELVDQTSEYGLTGAVFANSRYVLTEAAEALRNSVGNFYMNDKPTGAVVDQQPFGGSRASGTNDKAGSMLNLLRWVSARTIKETFVPPVDYKYPFLD